MTQNSLPDFARVEGGAIAGRYMAQFWQPIAMGSDYPVGKARRIKMLGNFYTLYRGEDERLRLTQDRCPHRGTSLAYGWVEGNSIRCRYHGWKFDGEGKGQHFPAETATYASKICLKTYPVREYLGLVFAFLGQGEAPEFQTFPEADDESFGELIVRAVELPYNFFQRIENDHDEVHAHYTHPQMESYGFKELPWITARETDYGLLSVAKRKEGPTFETHCFMPNVQLREVPLQQDKTQVSLHLAWRVPIDDSTTYSVMVNRVATYDESMRGREANMEDPGEIAARVMSCEISLDEVDPDYPLLPIVQDTVSIGGQGVIADRSSENLGQSDRAIALLRQLWAREMALLERGEPLKRWHRPKDFVFKSEDALSTV
ncbi:Rieske 2Fe-2S domain-containing protein [Sphingobium subterraneum]|uniref:5,5'-dehydrodivanillate O-demethylase n=1 Tax=Sphingobium subterraneum TaxID=627688 RepID=A0A841IVX7_9SPHN|nr:Rieske 2Fe-2S domain-containing protein [Sphingobium subterraneum]MBB6123069.1 5,5'-dehydrodivanillate O-demethylase [Sphingobium subterraneum]